MASITTFQCQCGSKFHYVAEDREPALANLCEECGERCEALGDADDAAVFESPPEGFEKRGIHNAYSWPEIEARIAARSGRPAGRAYTADLVGETRTDQAMVNVVSTFKHQTKAQRVPRVRKDAGYNWRMEQSQRKAGGEVRQGDARLIGEVSPELHHKMIRESGDDKYWSRDPHAALERHGLLVKRRR